MVRRPMGGWRCTDLVDQQMRPMGSDGLLWAMGMQRGYHVSLDRHQCFIGTLSRDENARIKTRTHDDPVLHQNLPRRERIAVIFNVWKIGTLDNAPRRRKEREDTRTAKMFDLVRNLGKRSTLIVQAKQLRGLDVIAKTQDQRVRRRMGRSTEEDAGFRLESQDLQHHLDHRARLARPGRPADEVRHQRFVLGDRKHRRLDKREVADAFTNQRHYAKDHDTFTRCSLFNPSSIQHSSSCSAARNRVPDSRSAGSGKNHRCATFLGRGVFFSIGEEPSPAPCLLSRISCIVVHAKCIKKKKREFMMKEMLKRMGTS